MHSEEEIKVSENSENMTKTVYGAVKGAIQEMSQTLVTTITKAFWNVSKERDDDNDKRHSRTAKHSRKSTPRSKVYFDSSSSDDSEEEYHSEAYTEDLDFQRKIQQNHLV